MMCQPFFKLFCAVSCLVWVVSPATAQRNLHVLNGDQGMVVSDSAIASRVGRDIMAQGGNAVDAAVATAFALAVTWPEAGNIGGGGFMMVHPADGTRPVCIDYREIAPAKARVDTYKATDSRHNRKAAGVPGTVRGLGVAHQSYGKLPWKDVVMPAVEIARDGFSVDQALANSTNSILRLTKDKAFFAELHRVYGHPEGRPWKSGDVMSLPDLSNSLQLIADGGPDAFYQGPLAEMLTRFMSEGTGMMTQADLDHYQAKVRDVIRGSFHGYEVLGAPPPSSGGTCVVQALNMVEALDIPKDSRYEPETIHLLAEVSRRIFLDRARHIGDPDFSPVPAHLTDKAYARKCAASIDRNSASDSVALAPEIEIAPESSSTTHFSVVDKNGMAVSNTYTLEASWGNRMVVPGAGYVLNNEMGDFNWLNGVTNRKGRIGTKPNLIQPWKRMLSSQCPVIVLKDGKVELVTGSPGGRTIINTVLTILLNRLHFDLPVIESVRAPRFHHQWLPDQLYLENLKADYSEESIEKLKAMGHKVVPRSRQGSAHTIWVSPDHGLVGIADHRRSGRPAGIESNRLALWDFAGKKGALLTESKSVGNLQNRWSGSLAGSSMDGADHFQIKRDAPESPAQAFVKLGEHDHRKLTATLELDGIVLAGKSRNEQVRLGFTQNDKQQPEVTARLIVGRTENDELVVSGEALGEGASGIPPVVLSKSNKLKRAIRIRLEIDLDTDRYVVSVCRDSQMNFREIGSGRIAPNREARFLRLSANHDFSSKGEYVNVDSIELSAAK